MKDEKFLKLLGKRIRELRLAKGLSQVDIGVAMDNYGEQIGRIERGEVNVTICTLKKISEVLDVTLSELFNL